MEFNFEYKVKDLITYESSNDVDIIKDLQLGEIDTIVDLISLGACCDVEKAVNMLDNALQSNTLIEIINNIVWCLIGKQEVKDDTPKMEKDEYKNLSNAFEIMYDQLQAVDDNISLSEFMNMSTRYLYRYADGIQKRYILNKNQELTSQYTSVGMLMSALAGKLKECPQLDETGQIKKMSLQERIIALKKQRDMR